MQDVIKEGAHSGLRRVSPGTLHASLSAGKHVLLEGRACFHCDLYQSGFPLFWPLEAQGCFCSLHLKGFPPFLDTLRCLALLFSSCCFLGAQVPQLCTFFFYYTWFGKQAKFRISLGEPGSDQTRCRGKMRGLGLQACWKHC